jgi:hypothetical protein
VNVAEIPPPESHFLSAAEGWLMLGDSQSAEAELGLITADYAEHPDFLEVRWRLSAVRKEWETALGIARQLVQSVPDRSIAWINQSYSLHELRQTDQAWNLLLPMADRFPKEPTIPYNLACYACQLGLLQDCRHWLRRAARIGSRVEILNSALLDPDLAPLRHELKSILRS